MDRTTWLQDRRMQKFRDVLSRWERKELSAQEAGEILGMSERQFRRYRRRYEEDGLAGLSDRRLGKASAKRVPVDKITWMLGQYRTQHMDWNVKHFHEHIQRQHGFAWGYTWTKTQLHAAGLVARSGIEHIPAYSPQARGRSERMFGTLQGRLPKELSLFGIRDIEAANRYIREVYLPLHNDQFAVPPQIAESAFVAVDPANLVDILCIEQDRVVARDNTVAYQGRTLQLPQSPARAHYVKANVKVREYPDGTLAVFHGPRRLARYSAQGHEIAQVPTTPSVTPCSPPSRRGLARVELVEGTPRRPSLTAAARGVTAPGQVGTKKRPSDRTKKLTRKKDAQVASL